MTRAVGTSKVCRNGLSVAALFVVTVALAACGGGTSTSSNQQACQQVKQAVNELASKHPNAKSVQASIAQAAQAAESTHSAQLRKLGANLTAASQGPAAPRAPVNFQKAGALSALYQACRPYF